MRDVKAVPLVAGKCQHPQIMTIRDGALKPADYWALPMLILHPVEGPILFDTGYDPAFFAASNSFPERFYRWVTPVTYAAGDSAAEQLSAFSCTPEDVRHVVLSHFHADHMAGVKQFPNAAIHCARAGFDAACTGSRFARVRKGILSGLLPADFAARARFFESGARVRLPPALQPFEDGVDLLGDGALLAVELPGHCPGHWGLLINDSAVGLHFLVADAAWSMDAIRRNQPPPAITSSWLGSTKVTRRTLAELHTLHTRAPDVFITPYHCPERAEAAKTARQS